MKIVIIKETFLESLKRDAFTVVSAWVMILPGWWIGSSALQWTGSIMFGLFFLARMAKVQSENIKTIAEARKLLDELEAE